jgi:hypothetical protein
VEQLVEALRYKMKAAVSIPDVVIGIFHGHNPSGLIEMSTRIFPVV